MLRRALENQQRKLREYWKRSPVSVLSWLILAFGGLFVVRQLLKYRRKLIEYSSRGKIMDFAMH